MNTSNLLTERLNIARITRRWAAKWAAEDKSAGDMQGWAAWMQEAKKALPYRRIRALARVRRETVLRALSDMLAVGFVSVVMQHRQRCYVIVDAHALEAGTTSNVSSQNS